MAAVADVRIVPATAAEWPAVAALLAQARLPALDAVAQPRDARVASDDTGVIGAIALERHGAYGLLRSLVVAPAARGRGVGEALVAAIEAHARAERLQALVLLTTTAERFFARRGYAAFAREDMPRELRASSEFSTLCPASAVCMRKDLAGGKQ